MGDNNQQEAADLDAMNDDDDDDDGILLEVTYRGGVPVNIPNVPFRLIIHASVTEIASRACWYCITLREVVFRGTNVTGIGHRAFAHCSNLQPVELPEGLLRLEENVFQYCTSLREIGIPASVQYMGDGVFYGCRSLERVVFVPRTTSIELGSYMFFVCSNLRFVTLPSNLRLIPSGCFQNCTSLTHLHIPVSVTEIVHHAFSGSGLRSITIPETVQQIDFRACSDCAFLERVIIYSTNLNLRTNIFVNCPLLSTIMIAPWLWATLFASMKEHPEFIFNFFRHYHTQILDVETPTAFSTITKRQKENSYDDG